MKLYFIRHGQSMGNLTGDYSDSLHGMLSKKGEEQALDLVKRLEDYKFDLILVSPLERTIRTILPYLKDNKLTGELWCELVEACWQTETTTTLPDTVRRGKPVSLQSEVNKYFTFRKMDERIFLPPDDENYVEGLERINWTYQYIMDNYAGSHSSILAIGHGHAGARLLERFLGIEPIGRFDHDNTGMSMLEELPDGAFHARYINRL